MKISISCFLQKKKLSVVEFTFLMIVISFRAYLGGASGKEPTCPYRRCKRRRFHPWVEKIPWREVWQPTPMFLPGESHGQRSLVGCGP